MGIQVERLSYVYHAKGPMPSPALQDVSLTIDDGQFVGLIGSTGSGKSTLIQHLNGLIRPEPGHVFVDGVDLGVRGVSLREMRQRVGLVFQYPERQLFEETVAADVAFGPRQMGLPDSEVSDRVAWALEAVGLETSIGLRSPFDLSGGQMRRVAIAGVLAMRSATLILDEPTAGLDPRGRKEILGEIEALHENEGITVILVSHNMEDVAQLADVVFVLHEGRLVLSGSPRAVYGRGEELAQWGLKPPQVTQVLLSLRNRGLPLAADLLSVPEARDEILRLWRGKHGPRQEVDPCA